MATLRDCYDKLIGKFIEFAAPLFPDNADVKTALTQLALAPMLMVCFKVSREIKPNFKDGKIDAKPIADTFTLDISELSEDNTKRLNGFIETLIMLSDEVIGAANETLAREKLSDKK